MDDTTTTDPTTEPTGHRQPGSTAKHTVLGAARAVLEAVLALLTGMPYDPATDPRNYPPAAEKRPDVDQPRRS